MCGQCRSNTVLTLAVIFAGVALMALGHCSGAGAAALPETDCTNGDCPTPPPDCTNGDCPTPPPDCTNGDCPTPTFTPTPVPPCAGCDTNGDRRVNFRDLARFSSSYGSSSGELLYREGFDFNHDGHLDSLDIAGFTSCYGRSW